MRRCPWTLCSIGTGPGNDPAKAPAEQWHPLLRPRRVGGVRIWVSPQGQYCSLIHVPQLGPHLRNGSHFQKDEDLAKLFSIILCYVLDIKLFRKYTELPSKNGGSRRAGNFWLIQHNLWGSDAGVVSMDTGCLDSQGTTLVVYLKLG